MCGINSGRALATALVLICAMAFTVPANACGIFRGGCGAGKGWLPGASRRVERREVRRVGGVACASSRGYAVWHGGTACGPNGCR